MDNRRNDQRHNVPVQIEVFCQEDGVLIGQLGDISKRGMMIYSPSHLSPEKDMAVYFEITTTAQDPTLILASLDTRWIRLDKNPLYNCVGCQFSEVNDDDFTTLESFRESISFSDSIDNIK